MHVFNQTVLVAGNKCGILYGWTGPQYIDTPETLLFPVQPANSIETLVEPELALKEWPRYNSRAQTVDSIKSEHSDSVTSYLEGSGAPATVDEKLASEENNKIIDDQKSIVDLVAAPLGTLSTPDDPVPHGSMRMSCLSRGKSYGDF